MTLLVAIFAALALFAGSALLLLVLVRRSSPTETRLAALQSQSRAAYDSEAPDKAQVHDVLSLLTSPLAPFRDWLRSNDQELSYRLAVAGYRKPEDADTFLSLKLLAPMPIYGPSNERDPLGLAADTAANPLIYIAPYKFVANNPLTYLGPYTYFSYVVMYNDLADSVGEYVRFSQAEMDPYSEIQYAWTFARANRVADFQVKGKQDEASLETIESVFFTFKDPEFPGHGKTRSVLIPTTGRKLKFTFWLQPGKANVVYIVPGLGSHRLAETSLALAELVYKNGFSAVCVSSPFNSEFMEHASTAAMPAYLPVDGNDLHVALTEIDHRLHALYPNRLGNRALMGYSMGAFESLFVAATGPTNQYSVRTKGSVLRFLQGKRPTTNQLPLIQFDRYVAINTPVRMTYGISKLDEFYRAPLDWPVAEQTDDLDNTFLKVAE